jgi:hypothetical protein
MVLAYSVSIIVDYGTKEKTMIPSSEKNMQVLETAFKQRAFDGKWERIVKIMDLDNSYSFVNENGNRTTLIPEKWVTVGVYDYLMEIVN